MTVGESAILDLSVKPIRLGIICHTHESLDTVAL
jgi:hypothetical protein